MPSRGRGCAAPRAGAIGAAVEVHDFLDEIDHLVERVTSAAWYSMRSPTIEHHVMPAAVAAYFRIKIAR